MGIPWTLVLIAVSCYCDTLNYKGCFPWDAMVDRPVYSWFRPYPPKNNGMFYYVNGRVCGSRFLHKDMYKDDVSGCRQLIGGSYRHDQHDDPTSFQKESYQKAYSYLVDDAQFGIKDESQCVGNTRASFSNPALIDPLKRTAECRAMCESHSFTYGAYIIPLVCGCPTWDLAYDDLLAPLTKACVSTTVCKEAPMSGCACGNKHTRMGMIVESFFCYMMDLTSPAVKAARALPFAPVKTQGEYQQSTPSKCAKTCRANNFFYAGVSKGKFCACHNSILGLKEFVDDDCGWPCTFDTKTHQKCGGLYSASVYETGLASWGAGKIKVEDDEDSHTLPEGKIQVEDEEDLLPLPDEAEIMGINADYVLFFGSIAFVAMDVLIVMCCLMWRGSRGKKTKASNTSNTPKPKKKPKESDPERQKRREERRQRRRERRARREARQKKKEEAANNAEG